MEEVGERRDRWPLRSTRCTGSGFVRVALGVTRGPGGRPRVQRRADARSGPARRRPTMPPSACSPSWGSRVTRPMTCFTRTPCSMPCSTRWPGPGPADHGYAHCWLSIGAPLRLRTGCSTARWCCTAAGCSAWSPRATCRATGSSTRSASSPRPGTRPPMRCWLAGQAAPFGADLLFEATDAWRHPASTSRSARTCGCRSRRAPLRGAGRRDGAGEPVGAATSPSARPTTVGCCASRSPRGASPPTSTRPPARASRPPTWRGTVTRWSTRTATCWPKASGSPTGEQLVTADVDLARLRSRPDADDQFHRRRPRPRRPAAGACAAIRFDLGMPAAAGAAAAGHRPLPLRAGRPDRAGTSAAPRSTTSRSRAWSRGCEPPAPQQVVIGVSGGLDSTQALIVAARAMDRLGLPRTNMLAYTMPGFATSAADPGQRASAHARTGGDAPTRSTSGRPPRRCCATSATPLPTAAPVYDVTYENVQAGERTSHLFRLANQHQALGRRHRGPVRAGAGLVHLRGR